MLLMFSEFDLLLCVAELSIIPRSGWQGCPHMQDKACKLKATC